MTTARTTTATRTAATTTTMVEQATHWSTESVPILDRNEGNAEIWKIIVKVVANQHGAQELLVREPGNETEMMLAHNLKQFLMETSGQSFQPLLRNLSALRAWKYLTIAVEVPVSPLFSPGAKHVPSNVSVRTAFNVKSDTAYDSGKLPHITQDIGHNGRIEVRDSLEPPENYPIRADNLIWEDIERIKKETDKSREAENNVTAGVLTRSESAPGRLELTKVETTSPSVPISPFKASSGRRRALLIGINYSGIDELRGCVRDQVFLAHLLRTRFGFQPEDMFMLTDEPHGVYGIASGKPTHSNILEAITWLMRDARQGDSLFFSFSGHGNQLPDYSGDEKNGFDDTICPVDYRECGEILDDTLYEMLVKRVPKGARLTAVIDSCSSGTVLDLPYTYDVNTGIRYDERTVLEEPEEEDGNEDEETPSRLKRLLRKLRLRRRRRAEAQVEEPEFYSDDDSHSCSEPAKYAPRPDSKGGEVILFSGCQDGQTAAKCDIAEKGAGLMTYSFVDVIERGRYKDWQNYTYGSLMRAIQDKVTAWQEGQDPQFSSSHPFNLDSPFLL